MQRHAVRVTGSTHLDVGGPDQAVVKDCHGDRIGGLNCKVSPLLPGQSSALACQMVALHDRLSAMEGRMPLDSHHKVKDAEHAYVVLRHVDLLCSVVLVTKKLVLNLPSLTYSCKQPMQSCQTWWNIEYAISPSSTIESLIEHD